MYQVACDLLKKDTGGSMQMLLSDKASRHRPADASGRGAW